jgi:hypothetical protein
MGLMKVSKLLIVMVLPVLVFAGTGPRASFDKDGHDYGRVMYGETVTEEFILTNTGDETLVIEKIKSSCDCTRAVKGSSEIPPNGNTKIVAAFDTTGLKPGRTKREIIVQTNDPQTPLTKLTLLAEVVRELTVDPPSLALRLPEEAAGATFSLKIKNLADKPCTVKGLQVPEGEIEAGMQPQVLVVEPHATEELNITVKLPNEPDRNYYMGRMVLLTDHARESAIDVRFLIHREKEKQKAK